MKPALGPALLFCPADRPDRFEKALHAADMVILDLEDAVRSDRLPGARQALLDVPIDPARTVVRVHALGSPEHTLDLAAVRRTPYRTIMLPKAEAPTDTAGLGEFAVIALCETPRGFVHAPAIASAPHVVGLMWGAEDLMASLGGTSSRGRNGRYRGVARHARSAALLAAASAGAAAIDAVYLDLGDLAGLRTESDDAAASGFAAKACVHPDQVAVVREAFQPSDAEVAWARRVLDAARDGGVAVVDGRMVDAPLVSQAERIAHLAGST